MKKSGNDPQPADQSYRLKLELQKLRKEGFADLAIRPNHYPVLLGIVTSKVVQIPPKSRPMERLEVCKTVFRAAFATLPTEGLRKAAEILFHMDFSGTMPPLDDRRRKADMAYYDRHSARQPDTIQRFLENQQLDPLLVEALEKLPPVGDDIVSPQPTGSFVPQSTYAAASAASGEDASGLIATGVAGGDVALSAVLKLVEHTQGMLNVGVLQIDQAQRVLAHTRWLLSSSGWFQRGEEVEGAGWRPPAPGATQPQEAPKEDRDMQRRRFTSLSGQLAAAGILHPAPGQDCGLLAGLEDSALELGHRSVPTRVTAAHVDDVESVTAALRAVDYRCGGGACLDALIGHLRSSERLLGGRYDDRVRVQLLRAVADVNNQVGWESHDTGHHRAALVYFAKAREQALAIGEHSLAANVFCQAGWVYLHIGQPDVALQVVQLGKVAAQKAGSSLTAALSLVSEALAYGNLGDELRMRQSIQQAQDEFARAELGDVPPWLRFFLEIGELDALSGNANAALTRASNQAYKDATSSLYRVVQSCSRELGRERVVHQIPLAIAHIVNGDTDVGVQLGHEAVTFAGDLRSPRVIERLAALHQAAVDHGGGGEVTDLAERIALLRAA